MPNPAPTLRQGWLRRAALSALLGGAAAGQAAAPTTATPAQAPAQTQALPVTAPPVAIEPQIDLLDPGFVAQFALDPSRRMTVGVTIDGQGPFPFVIDTGSQRTIIARELAARLSLAPVQRVTLATLSGRAETQSYRIAALDTANVRLEAIEAPALGAYDLGAAGLLGVDSLQGRRAVFDFRRHEIVLRASAPRERATIRDPDAIVVRARDRVGRLILSDAWVGDTRVSLVVDTGAATSIGNLALMAAVQRNRRLARSFANGSVTSVTGDAVPTRDTVLTAIRIGRDNDASINDLPISFADSHAFHALGLHRRPALLLGMDALHLFDQVEIDFTNRRVVFALPDSAEAQPRSRWASRW